MCIVVHTFLWSLSLLKKTEARSKTAIHTPRKSDVAALREEKYDSTVSVCAKLSKELLQCAGKLPFAHVSVSYNHIILVCVCCSYGCSRAWQVQLWVYSSFSTSAFLQWSADFIFSLIIFLVVFFFFFLVAYYLHFCVILSLLVLCCSGNCQDIFRLIFPSSPLHHHHVVSGSFCSCFVSCVTATKENLPLWGSFQAKPACFKIGVGTSKTGTPNDSVWITTALPLTVKGRAKTYTKSVGVFMSVHLHNMNSHSCATESNAARYNVSPGKYLPRAETREVSCLCFLSHWQGRATRSLIFFPKRVLLYEDVWREGGERLWLCRAGPKKDLIASLLHLG